MSAKNVPAVYGTALDHYDPATRDAVWRTLSESLYPGASTRAVISAVDYCRARGLDVLKRPVHIIQVQVAGGMREVVIPGIYELRTTAMRTGLYMGASRPEYGPTQKWSGIEAPEWCEITVYRWVPAARVRAEFHARVYFREVCKPNARWKAAPIQMLTKCTEAAALRAAFPDTLGGIMSAEEMSGATIDADVAETQPAASQVERARAAVHRIVAPQDAPAPAPAPEPKHDVGALIGAIDGASSRDELAS